ncbi:hypothetical protein IQ266_11605 [filamentous cyanobacterium LEGE 11480]|uniref:DUF6737 domain-containing protein n=1 Tax=Romeriopsis navalis LEGE 11480 TaxID=2777977 RepID=A0A928Z3U8_9CYAN|nr:DUF6737 family protein [Romeriopsis navalis]MBE9030377.1 hypothetical protein [Romeriopsis navalis LEGE 11480]
MTSSNPDQSTETDSIWDYKPWWCQPWSILLTGTTIISGSWLVFHRYWLTGLVAIPLIVWMSFFILVFPKLARESGMLEEMKQAHPTPPPTT